MKVGFIGQLPEVWDKQMTVFETLLRDSRFDPYVIYVSRYDFVKKTLAPDDENDRKFYTDLYGQDRVLCFSSMSESDLDSYAYLFYDRPFNHYLPGPLQSVHAAARTRLCHILYGAYDWDTFPYELFSSGISIWFASNIHELDAHKALFGDDGVHSVYYPGYAAYEYYHGLTSNPGKNRILWSPRWSFDPVIGGSHFLEYINNWIEYVSRRRDVKLVIRPHPLLFDNLLSEHIMTAEEIDALKARCASAGITFDHNRIVADTFRNTDIVVSDYSSILGLFLAMDKPIIYCMFPHQLTQAFLKQLDAMYHAESWEDIEKALDMLLDGEDPLREKRREVIDHVLLEKRNAAEKIADILAAYPNVPKTGQE